MSGVVAAYAMAHGLNPWLSILCGVLSGTIAGTVNGLVVTRLKINSFIATLGMLSIAQGVALLISGGMPLTLRGPFQFLGQGKLGPMPFPAIIMFATAILGALFMGRGVLARQAYAVGANDMA